MNVSGPPGGPHWASILIDRLTARFILLDNLEILEVPMQAKFLYCILATVILITIYPAEAQQTS
ncbi:MAG TPA: hypothetical protein VK603_23670, partial [Candidatus Saccharimonadales bacterium]|nr:hypothetical protein [Candidatus Saccharimonadales bacterium]